MLEDRFTELLAKKLSGEITPEESAEFGSLLAGNEAYSREYETIKTYWQQDEQPYDNAVSVFEKIKLQTDIHQREAQHNSIRPVKRSFAWIGAAAAVILILIISVFVYKGSPSHSRSPALQTALKELQTPSRITSRITLSDGTHVTLNAESDIKYPASFKGSNREVYLSGEAYFDVKHDAQHPFIVHTPKFNIRVLGTAFNVKCYANDKTNEATLLRGSIRVTMADKNKTAILMKPADKMVVQGSQYYITKQTFYDQAGSDVVETAWLNNKLTFKNEPFDQLANALARHFGASIKFQNNNLKNFTFTGDFERENLNQILLSLQIVKPFRYTLRDNNVVIF